MKKRLALPHGFFRVMAQQRPNPNLHTEMKLIIAKNIVSPEALAAVPVPHSTDTFQPIPHSLLVDMTRQNLRDAGFEVIFEEHAIAREGQRYFGGFAITGTEITAPDRQLVVGLRNSHDKGFAASICLGDRMIVCENLCFSASIKLARKHTTFILRDLNAVIARAVGRLTGHFGEMNRRIDAYKASGLLRPEAAELVYLLARKGALPPREIFNTISEWESPRHAEFAGGTLWTLFNAVTEQLKGSDLTKLPDRTMTMQSIFDTRVGFDRVVDIDTEEVEITTSVGPLEDEDEEA
jgi:hypothetical protein